MRDERTPEPPLWARNYGSHDAELFKLIVAEHPVQIHVNDLQRLIGHPPEIIAEMVAELAGFGLVNEGGGFVALSHAAVRFIQLTSE